MLPAQLMPIVSPLLWSQTAPVDSTPWVPLTQWSDIPFALIGKIVFVPLLVATIVWAVARFRALREGGNYSSPRRLFSELCALHELDWPARKLLRQMARSRQLEHPAQVFLDPAGFDPSNVPPALQPFRAELQRLKARLF